ncbi:MAG TPA: pilus assembly protein TadG-related protein [Bauldia sp.]|nr:pilus assembly protein TadG-related protein [Bauldia sp.]
MPSRIIETIASLVTRLRSSQSGNVAVIFAIACVPLVVATGALVDFSRAAQVREAMQDAADAAALNLSRVSDVRNMSANQLSTTAKGLLKANFNVHGLSDLNVTASYVAKGPSVVVNASGSLPLNFGGLVGLSDIDITAKSTTVWGQTRLRVALVLDNTGSMQDSGKMTALKSASHNLLQQIEDATTRDGDAYVSIVPFAKDVNAGASNYKQAWVRWDLFDELNGRCSSTRYSTKSSCTKARKKWTATNHKNWNGCVTDRDKDYDLGNDEPVTSRSGTLFPAEQYDSCPSQVTALTDSWTSLGKAIDSMKPNGGTNQAIGLQWGWQSLTANPFDIPDYDPDYEYRQVIILLTDGLNTQDRWYGNGSDPAPAVDDRQADLCANIKKAGIQLYTVQVDTGHDPKSQMLEDCASTPNDFFLLKSADQIVTTFDTIGSALSDLRLES